MPSKQTKINKKKSSKSNPVKITGSQIFLDSPIQKTLHGKLSKTEYKEVYNCYHKIKAKNWFIRQFNNWGLVPVNALTSTAVSVTSNVISKSLGLAAVDTKEAYKEYFGKMVEIDIDTINIDKEYYSKESLKQFLDDLLDIVKKVGFVGTVVLFDKIDEFQDLNQDITQIVNFTKEILTDTELLMNERLAIGFSLWSELKVELFGKVRFDKFGSIDVSWLDKDLEPLINKRIKHFSIKNDIVLANLILLKSDKDELIKVSNQSPRDLISALAEIYKEQSNGNQSVKSFDSECINNGLIRFCKTYDYDSIFPGKAGKNKEIRAMINKLLYMQIRRFTAKQLGDGLNLTPAQSDGHIKIMTNYKLIREDDILSPDNVEYYEVIDPKVEFLIKMGVPKME